MTRVPLERRAVEVRRRQREAIGVAADLVERGEPEVAIERRVLDALRHHRTRGLLPAHDELVELRRAILEQHDAAKVAGQALRHAPVLLLDPAGLRLDVGAVDVQRRRSLLEAVAWEQATQPLELVAKRRA